jgi:hypothetical protein
LHNYHYAFHCFPPAYIADKNGKPMHSWRVLILPFIEESAKYKQYNFSEPWDGPNNKMLLASRPSVYVCPSDEDASREGRSLTSYVAVVGPNAAWHGNKPRSFNDAELRGKSSTTIMLVETANAGVNWTEPRDLSLDALQSADSPPGSVTFMSKHGWRQGLLYDYEPVSANVALADGAVMFLSARTMAPKGLRKLLTIGGFTDEYRDGSGPYPAPQPEAKLRWQSCLALAVWFLSVGLLLHRAVRRRKARQPVANSGP